MVIRHVVLFAPLGLLACGGAAAVPEPAASAPVARESQAPTAPVVEAEAAPSEELDWDALAAESEAWTPSHPGRAWRGGGTVVQLVRPVELAAPAACAPPAPTGVPRVRAEPDAVGPSPPFPPQVFTRVLRRDAGFAACASCVAGTDVFELRVGVGGDVEHVEPRARTHDDDARTRCLAGVLAALRLPESSRGTVRAVVPIRVRVAVAP